MYAITAWPAVRRPCSYPMRALFLSIILAIGFLNCSSAQVQNKYDACEKITIGPGTEDFALSPDGNTIYVSSHERRGWETPGELFAYNIKTRQVKKLARTGEPEDLFFAPHGVDVYAKGAEKFLYVVNHGKKINDADQSVVVYRLSEGALTFVTRVRHEFINSPNDVAVAENGSFYVTNDHGSRGSLWEVFWGLRRSKIAFCSLQGLTPNSPAQCVVATEGLAMANGPLVQGNLLYVTATRDDALFVFTRQADGTLADKKKVAGIPGGDNLAPYKQWLITASHTSNWKFFRHVSSASNKAPSSIVAVDPLKNTVIDLYFSDGNEISAASGAFIHNGRLFISQVFEDFILECRPVQ